MTETRRMHFVPRTYLKHFAKNKNGEYFISVLSKDDNRVFETNIKNVCQERDLYKLDGATEFDRQFVEVSIGLK